MGRILDSFWVFLCLCIASFQAEAENGITGNGTETAPPPVRTATGNGQFRPGIAVTVGIFTTLFSITFLLLLYVKHCKMGAYTNSSRAGATGGRGRLPRENSGIDPRAIQSLPIFRFSSLRGQKDGLECAVCLNKFEPEEVLRLLPKCKHAFHVECVDTWLEVHPTCPLCRYRVDPDDVLFLDSKALYNHRDHLPTPRGKGKGMEANTPRLSDRHSSAGETGGSLDIIVENPRQGVGVGVGVGRGRVSLDGWNYGRRRSGWSGSRRRDFLRCKSMDSWKARRDTGLLSPAHVEKHRVEHRIIISGEEGEGEGEEGRRRWSDVEAADLLYLRSEMIIGDRSATGSRVVGGRSASEIMGLSRYDETISGGHGRGRREERERREGEGVVKRWLAWISHSQPLPQQQSTTPRSATAVVSSSPVIVV